MAAIVDNVLLDCASYLISSFFLSLPRGEVEGRGLFPRPSQMFLLGLALMCWGNACIFGLLCKVGVSGEKEL